jgi:flagellar hook assembly protein FlgD
MAMGLAKQVEPREVAAGKTLSYSLNLTVSNNTAYNTAVTDVLPDYLVYLGPGVTSPPGLPTPSLSVSGVTMLVWNLPELAMGNYTLTYHAKVDDFADTGYELVNRAVAVSPQLPDPLSASVTATVTGNYTVKIGVYNEAGEMVKEILVDEFAQPIENIRLEEGNVIESLKGENHEVKIYYGQSLIGTWDGTNRNNDLVTNGDYYIKVDNIDSYGVVKTTTQKVLVNRAIYQATINIYNEAGEVIRRLYTYLDDPGPGGVLSMQLSAGVIKPSLRAEGGTPNEVAVILSNGTTVIWDGRSDTGVFVNSGQYFIEVHTVDGQGAQATVVREIAVIDTDAGRGIERVAAIPNVLNEANGYLVRFTTKTAVPLTLKASIYTMAGELVGSIEGLAGTNEVKWDASNLVSGLYLAIVEQVDAQGRLLSRQTQKIAVVR